MSNYEVTVTDNKSVWYVDTPDIEFHWDWKARTFFSNDPTIFVDEWGLQDMFMGTQYILHIGEKRIGFQEYEFDHEVNRYIREDGAPVTVVDIMCSEVVKKDSSVKEMFGDRYAHELNTLPFKKIGDGLYRTYTNTYKFTSVEEQYYVMSLFAKAYSVPEREVLAGRDIPERNYLRVVDYSDELIARVQSGFYIEQKPS